MAKVILEHLYKSFSPSGTKSIPSETESNLSKSNQANVLRDINLTVNDGEFMVLVGPSGCGKSTLLRLICGLETATGGNIKIGDCVMNTLPPKQRNIAMVFQNYALYPHMNVYDNIAFGLRRMSRDDSTKSISSLPKWLESALVSLTRSLPKSWRYLSATEQVINEKVSQVVQLLELDHLLDRFPKELSGGQKQRVALGRAISRKPQVFLMDEPLSNLDTTLRVMMRSEIVQLQRKMNITTIYVTHDQTEAMTMGDRIAVINGGEIQQLAPPLELYNHPANRFVAEFIGLSPMNFIEVTVDTPVTITHPQFFIKLPQFWEPYLKKYVRTTVYLGIRPEHLTVSFPSPNNLEVKVNSIENLGNETSIFFHLVTDINSLIKVCISSDDWAKFDQNRQSFWLSLNPAKIHLFDYKTQKSIQNILF
ncbi:ABC transporter ATP-binding protein [cyanobacterium endosymbiont of Epithemia turgida]|uniref:ABC transporter ATP-binding protein n=1 Tax=cyanobacterium endosymbiont of Epithemia turgida TaxID=718217 RepID=UPI0004D102ED|nr:ABC transporter ATP-binding protein [cyanobacterium endosymbiont of Epithemia turgida]BAP17890.1 sugar ABC transporter ATP-binding protein [cyanobacterium endosymbiont of Epithemia turgida isolate EtSB Lake Yunoko]